MRHACGLIFLCVVCLAGGCGRPASGAKELKSVSTKPPRPVDGVDRVDFWAVPPAAINWDEIPGADGVQARVYLFRADRPDPVLVKGGLEFLMYAGRAQQGTLPPAEPLKAWSFTADDLVAQRARSMVGWGYAAQLGWGKDVPTAPVITLRARYQPPKGPPVYSAPISIAMPDRVRSGPVKSIIGGAAARKRPDQETEGNGGEPSAPVPPQAR